MAEKKYLDITGLGQYDAKIKALIDSKDAAKLAEAKAYADGLAGNYEAAGNVAAAKTELEGKITAVQGEVDALETLVGELPEGATVNNVVAYVDQKTAGIATEGAMTELAGRVTQAEKDIDAIEADYLKAADKTELSDAITAEANRAKGIEGGLETRLAAVEADYLVEADKTELVGAIATAKQEAIEAVLDGVTDDFDTLKEVAAWIQSDTTRAAELTTRVSTAEDEIDTLQSEMDAVEGRMDTAEADIDALQALFGDGEGSVSDQIADAVAAEKAERVAADEALQSAVDAKAAQSDLTALAGRVTTAEGDIDQLQADVATKAAQTVVDGIGTRLTAAEGEIDALQADTHSHSNKSVLDLITADLKASYDDAVTKAHVHENADVLNGITSALVTSWSNAESNAKGYTDEKIGEFKAITTGEVDALFA